MKNCLHTVVINTKDVLPVTMSGVFEGSGFHLLQEAKMYRWSHVFWDTCFCVERAKFRWTQDQEQWFIQWKYIREQGLTEPFKNWFQHQDKLWT